MATVASLNILLHLNAKGVTSGLRNAQYELRDFTSAVAHTNQRIAEIRMEKSLLPRKDKEGRKALAEELLALRQLKIEQSGLVVNQRDRVNETRKGVDAVREQGKEARLNAAAEREQQRARDKAIKDDVAGRAWAVKMQRDVNARNAKEEKQVARDSLRAAQQQRQAFLGVSKGIGQVGNAAAAAGSSIRGMLTFGAGRVAGGVGGAMGNMAQVVGSVIGPFERIGQTVSSVVGGGFSAAGKIVGAFGDLLGLTISGASIAIGKLGGSILGLIPMIGPALSGIMNMFGELGTVVGSVVGGAFRVFGEILGGVGKIAGEVLGGLTSALVTVGSMAVVTAARFENLQLSLEVMTGSATRARAIMQDIFQFAAVTPLEVMDVAKATQSLTAVGIEAETALEMVKKLSNISAAMPGDMADNLQHVTRALAQMHAKGTVQAEEMTRQLANAGIPAWKALAAQIGVTEARAIQMARAGQISARDGIMAILTLADSPRFATMGLRQSQTLFGLWSTLKDNMTLLMADIGNAIIEAFDLKGMTTKLTEVFAYLRSNIESIKPALVEIGTVFRATFDIAISMVKMAVDALKDWSGQIGGAPTGLQTMRDSIIDGMEVIGKAVITTLVSIANKAVEIINKIRSLVDFSADGNVGPGQVRRGSPAHMASIADRQLESATDRIAKEIGWKGRHGVGAILGAGGLAATIHPREFALVEAAAAKAKAALAAVPNAAGPAFDPAGWIQSLKDGLNTLRATSAALGQGPNSLAGILGGGLATIAKQFNLPFVFGKFSNGIDQAIDKMNEFARKQREINDLFMQLKPHLDMAKALQGQKFGMGDLWREMPNLVGKAVPAVKALVQAWRDMGKAMEGVNPLQKASFKEGRVARAALRLIGAELDKINAKRRLGGLIGGGLMEGRDDPFAQFQRRKEAELRAEASRLAVIGWAGKGPFGKFFKALRDDPEVFGAGIGGGMMGALQLPFKNMEKDAREAAEKAEGPIKSLFQTLTELMEHLKGPAADIGIILGGGIVGGLKQAVPKVIEAERALNMAQGQVLRDMRAAFGPKNIDVAAMQKGSQEAASAINRAINEAKMPSGDPTVEELRMLRAVAEEQRKELERIGARMRDLDGAFGVGGVGP